MKKILIIICLACCSCCSQLEQMRADRRAGIREATAKRAAIHQKAIGIAITKYLLDPSWTFKEIEKEIRYQEYLLRQQ